MSAPTNETPEATGTAVGRYVVFGEIAAGGMATVHLGRLGGSVGFARTVAVKRLHAALARDPELVTMFLEEARLCARIRHPNVVPTLDVVTAAGEILLVMEYVPGASLAALTRSATAHGLPATPGVAASILAGVLHGLHAAHTARDEYGAELGIVHRDVSPQNVLVGTDGVARLLDFGVAKAKGRAGTTGEGRVKGKLGYIPPELFGGARAGRAGDLYAAGVVLWELLTGRRLFDAETEAQMIACVLEGAVQPPSAIVPSVPKALDDVVMGALARDPAARAPSARDMAMALEAVPGFASPREVGDWVEAVAGDELAERAARVAAVERAPLPAVVPTPATRPEVDSVSEVSVATAKGAGLRYALLVPLVLASVGVGLAAFALPRLEGTARTQANVAPSPAPRPLAVERPAHAAQKQRAAATVSTIAAPARPTSSCDPPFTVDPATGRKKYKRNCL